MTPTLDNMEQLVGLLTDGNATVIGGTWGFPAILELEKVLSDGTTAVANKKKGLTTRFVARAYIPYVLGSFLFPPKKGTDVNTRYLYLFAKDKVVKKWPWGSAVLAYMYYNLGTVSRDDGRKFACCTTLLEIFAHFPKLVGIPKEMDSDAYEHCTCWKWDVSVTDRYGGTTLLKFRKALDNYKLEDTMICPITVDLAAADDVGIHQWKEASVNEYGDTPVHQSEDVAEQYDASVSTYYSYLYLTSLILYLLQIFYSQIYYSQHDEHASLSLNAHGTMQTRGGTGGFDQQITTLNDQLQKLKEDKEKESEANINLREALKEKTSECDLQKEAIEQMKEDIELKCVVDEQCALEFADLPRQLDAKYKESESLKVVNALLMEQIDLQLPPATPLAVLQSHQPMPDATLDKKYENLLAVHEDVTKKLIVKENFEVWRQALKKAVASEGIKDMGDPREIIKKT
ncbi:hypothetical protein GIB67_035541 [Kingdonia uniflora]|uniref:Aminotransferase-like plant mobile domain-containing protein n=1 Tax=Kingdonia uniflora TaxID=39325 RepID=A0A7J7MC50_9MAGN|nr:hypothetical protein GIB67_035541 [Kingdonia uniflora]